MVRIRVQTLHPTKKTPTPTKNDRGRRELGERELGEKERKKKTPSEREKIWVEIEFG